MDDFREQKGALDGLGAQSVHISWDDDLFPLHQEISNGRTHLTDPEKTWVYNSSIATYISGSVGIRIGPIYVFDGFTYMDTPQRFNIDTKNGHIEKGTTFSKP